METENLGQSAAFLKKAYLILDDCRKRKIVKKIRQVFPNVGVAVLSKAFVVKSINLGNRSAFMVPS